MNPSRCLLLAALLFNVGLAQAADAPVPSKKSKAVASKGPDAKVPTRGAARDLQAELAGSTYSKEPSTEVASCQHVDLVAGCAGLHH